MCCLVKKKLGLFILVCLSFGVNLPILLNAIVTEFPPDASTMLRIGMTNPLFILEHLKEIAEVLRHPCVYSFLHVPVQSGSDAVLTVKQMKILLKLVTLLRSTSSRKFIFHSSILDLVEGLTNNSYQADSHEVRHCVQKYKLLGEYVLQVAKKKLDDMLVSLRSTENLQQQVHCELRKWLHANPSPEVAATTRIIYGGAVMNLYHCNIPDLENRFTIFLFEFVEASPRTHGTSESELRGESYSRLKFDEFLPSW